MTEILVLKEGDEFFEVNDHDVNRPIRLVSGQELVLEPTGKKGGPSGRTRGWRVARNSRAVVVRIGRADRKFTFPPTGQTPVIFPRSRR